MKKDVMEVFNDERKKTVETILTAIEEHPLEWQKQWAAMGGVRNGISGAKFHGGNVLHALGAMMRHGYKDPRFCSFGQAMKAGLTLKEGEKHVMILEFWKKVGWKTTETDSDGNEVEEYHERMKAIRYTPMFNFEQFENAPELVEESTGFTEDDATRTADRLISGWVCPIVEEDFDDSAYYSPYSDMIGLPNRHYFVSGESFLRTMLHEMVHSTGAAGRLNRGIKNTFGTESYAKEELIAELGAIFAASELGFEAGSMDSTHFKLHAAYLKSWLQATREEPKYLFTSASEASRACDYIMGIINDEAKMAA